MFLLAAAPIHQLQPAPWQPLAGAALLAELRGDPKQRGEDDPGLAGGLRAWLEDGLHAAQVATQPPLELDKATVARAGAAGPAHHGARLDLLRGALVAALFRQFVTLGPSTTPFEDALASLGAERSQAGLVSEIDGLATEDLVELAADLERHHANLASRWPTLNPKWLPRTAVAMRVGLAGGRVVLRGRVDLMVGVPNRARPSVGLISVRSTPLHPLHREELHFLALLETLRSGVPPRRVATYSTLTGEVEAESVDAALLIAAVERTLATVEAHRQAAAA